MDYSIFRYECDKIPDVIYRQVFGVRPIADALHCPVCFNDCDKWFFAVSPDKVVIGFGGYELSKRGMHIRRCFTFPEHRKKGVFDAIVKEMLKEGVYPAYTEAVSDSKRGFEKNGFAVVKHRFKNVWWMKKER